MLEEKKIGCIAEAFRLREENKNDGEVIWVREIEHAYFLHPNGATLNLGDNGFSGFPNFTRDELLELINSGDAQYLIRRE